MTIIRAFALTLLLASCASSPAQPPPEWPPHAAQRGYCADWRAF